MSAVFFSLFLLLLFDSDPKTPKDYIWKNRILIVQSQNLDSVWFDPALEKELKIRKLFVFHFDNENFQSTSKDQINVDEFLKMIPNATTDTVQWVLIGLDGGVKNSGNKLPSPKEIFGIIDAMPMRQSEMRRQKKDNNSQ